MAKRNPTLKPELKSTASREKVYEVAAEVFHRRGYDNTSMNDIAAAVGLTKAGLYHHVSSKESLLYTILENGMDLTEAYVLEPLETIADPALRLKKLIELHLRLILEGRQLAVTGLLHECQGLSERDQVRINRRKKEYVRFVTELVREVIEKRRTARPVNPKTAALALLGMLNWTYQWYKSTGPIQPDQIVLEFQQLFMFGILGAEDC